MNNLLKSSSRFVNLAANNAVKDLFGKRNFTRTLWQLSSKKPGSEGTQILKVQHNPSFGCSCGCNGAKHVHTKGERELVEFLTEEIIAERKTLKNKSLPTNLDGFAVKYDGADVEMTKQSDKEKIIISFSINHTVDTEGEPEIDPNADKPDVGEMRSKPRFEIDVIKGKTTLSFTCTFLEGVAQEGEYNDVFGIEEMCIFDNEWHDKIYAVAGDVLDGYLYDLLMNFLDEKGISNEFVEKLSDLSTTYEHTSYINLLERLSKFTTGK